MKIKANISYQTLINYLKLDAEIIGGNLDNYPVRLLKDMPTDLYQIKFETFAKSVRYADKIDNSVEFLHRLTGLDSEVIKNKKAIRIYPIYIYYLKQVQVIMTKFAEVNAELPQKGRTVRTMEEFGMSNIIDFIADGRLELHDIFYEKTVGWVFVEYMRKVHKLLNTLANNGTNTK